MAQYGVLIGAVLIAVAIAVAFLIGARAARSVAEFRAEDHEAFTREEKP